MMKKWTALLLTLALVMGCAAGAAAEETGQKAAITVGGMSQLTGGFFTELWGNNTADIDVRGLIHGYSTVAWTYNGEYAVDATVVKNVDTTRNPAGDKTYAFTINDQLLFSDGSPIDAYDYAFSVLLLSSPLLAETGARNDAYSHLVGGTEYASGEAATFSGLRVTDATHFSVTIRAQNLPYYYELMLAEITPYPVEAIMPGCAVRDDGEGAYIDDSAVEGGFTADMLTEAVLNPETGYRTHPAITSGPYVLTSYDAETRVAEFDKNPLYLGNFEGRVPEIEHITYKCADKTAMLDELESGDYDILNKVTEGAVISDGMARVAEDRMAAVNYLRSGYGFLGFACEQGATASADVRKAVAMCVDSEAFCRDYLMGYGLPVYGYYGYGQWMVTMRTEQLDEMNVYTLNTNAASFLLADDGWTLNEAGAEFDAEADNLRYKLIDGQMTPLTLRLAVSEGSGAADEIVAMLSETLPQIGAELTVTKMPYAELLSHYYRQTERGYDMFFLATNFAHVFDPYYTYSADPKYQGVYNTSGLADETLEALAQDMRRTESDDTEGYLDKWMAFQTRWTDLMPCVPIYSNVYFDFYDAALYGYAPNTHWGWASAIVYASYTPPAPEETAEPEEDDDVVIID